MSYDRVAECYDETRRLPDAIARRLTSAVLRELQAVGARVALEVGVGTGRIARPLARRGIRVVGVDVAPRMLNRLRQHLSSQSAPVDIILGDAAHLPIARASFRAALMFHVLHLIVPWQAALEEIRRALAPGGVLIHDETLYGSRNPWDASLARWNELMAARGASMRSRPGSEEVHGKLRALGGACREIWFAKGRDSRTPEENLERIRTRIDSWSWEISDDVFADCFAEFEPWYKRHYGNMYKQLVQSVSYGLSVWTFD